MSHFLVSWNTLDRFIASSAPYECAARSQIERKKTALLPSPFQALKMVSKKKLMRSAGLLRELRSACFFSHLPCSGPLSLFSNKNKAHLAHGSNPAASVWSCESCVRRGNWDVTEIAMTVLLCARGSERISNLFADLNFLACIVLEIRP